MEEREEKRGKRGEWREESGRGEGRRRDRSCKKEGGDGSIERRRERRAEGG